MSSQYDNEKIIPQPFDNDTPEKAFADAVIKTLPAKDGKSGKFLKVSGDEETAEWSHVSGTVKAEVTENTLKIEVNK